jgi:autophagy-related protein 2
MEDIFLIFILFFYVLMKCLFHQITAETAYDMLSPGPSVRQRRLLGSGATKRRRTRAQPADIREGVTNAYHLVQEVSQTWPITNKDESENHWK